jgi:arylsulfatase A-like enzyme
MTGFHSGHFGAHKLPGTQFPTSLDILTTPEMLQKAGYATAGIGKMAPLNAPVLQGFDYFIGQINQGLCHNMYPHAVDTGNTTGLNVNLSLNYKIPGDPKAARTACMAEPSEYNYTVDITHEHSMAWIQNSDGKLREADKPFFLYEAFTVPHAGGWGHAPSTPESGAPVPSDGQYAGQSSWPDVEKDHAAVITYLDDYVGKLVALLKSEQLETKTVVFFASGESLMVSVHAQPATHHAWAHSVAAAAAAAAAGLSSSDDRHGWLTGRLTASPRFPSLARSAADNGAHLEGGHNYHFFNSTGGLLGHKRSLCEWAGAAWRRSRRRRRLRRLCWCWWCWGGG